MATTSSDDTDYGFNTSSGFTYPTLTVINNERLASLRGVYGTGFSDDKTNSMWRNSQIDAEREYKVWQMVAMMEDYQTFNGAEDIYLDDICNRVGIYRKDASASAGYAVIESDDTISTDDELDDSYSFSNDDGDSFKVESTATFGDLVCGIYITPDDLPDTATSYSFVITNVSDSTITETVTVSGISSSSDETDINSFFQNLLDAVETVSDSDSDDTFEIYSSSDGYTLAIGYDEDGNLVGLSDPVQITATTDIGLKASKFYVECTDTGYLSITAGGITSITPTDAGFQNITNVDTFATGGDVESDASLRVRYQLEVGAAGAGTKTSIIKAVLAVDDVTSCIIKDNPSNTDKTYATARTFNTVVQGGADEDIAQAISDNKPINTQTYGSSSYAIVQEDNNLEVIYFTRATTVQLYLKITYSTNSGISFTTGEKTEIEDAIQDVVDTYTIGGTVFMTNLSSAIIDALDTNRLSDLVVSYSTDEETWLTSNYIPDYNAIPTVDIDTGITYVFEENDD